MVFEKDGHRFKGSEVTKEYSASKLQQTFTQHQVQVPALVQHADQAYEAEALNRLFQEQARQAQEKAQEMARQAQQAAQQQRAPGRSQDSGLSL